MKTKLLRKLRSKFYIKRNVYGFYYVEDSGETSYWECVSINEARNHRRNMILRYARYHYPSYSIWYRRKLS